MSYAARAGRYFSFVNAAKSFWEKGVFCCVVLGLVLSTSARGEQVVLAEKAMQGELLIGHTLPDSRVFVDDKAVRVSEKGAFLVAIERHRKTPVSVRMINRDGQTIHHTVSVEKRQYPVERINNLATRDVSPDEETLQRIKADINDIIHIRRKDTVHPYFESGFVWPVFGRISGEFGSRRILNGKPRSDHKGIDIAAPEGSMIVAVADGVVRMVRQDMVYTGRTLMIDHGHGLHSIYAHMSAILVKKGDLVQKGMPVARVGATGRATGPHLHWGMSLFQTHLDPALLVDSGPLQSP